MATKKTGPITPGERQIERLAIIRQQISYAQEQATYPSPLDQIALGTTQDFAESALHVVAESHKIPLPNPSFDPFLEGVVKKLGDTELSGYVVLIKAMNKARVNFKHYGNSSDKRDINAHLTESVEFVRRLCACAYGTDLDAISIIAFIKNAEVKQHLESADKKQVAGDPHSLIDLRIAFDELIRDYIERKTWSPGTSIFSTRPSFMPSDQDMRYLGIEKIVDWIDNIDGWVKYTSLGIDMRRYAFFDAHTPHTTYSMNGTPHTDLFRKLESPEEVYQKCRRFVVDTALALAQNDFDFDAWSSRRMS